MKRPFARAGLAACAVALAVTACELGLRAAGYPHWALLFRPAATQGFELHEPNQEVVWPGGERVRINSLGLRGDEPAHDACSTALLLGDSFTFLDGYPQLLAAMLRQRYGPRVDVVNGGYLGRTIDHELVVFREQGASVDPDVVVLQFFVNDIENLYAPTQLLQRSFPFQRYIRPTAIYQLIAGDVIPAIRDRVQPYLSTPVRPIPPVWHRTDEFYTEPLPPLLQYTWNRYLDQLETLIRAVHGSAARLLILLIPDWYQVTHGSWEPVPQRMIADRAGRHEVPVLDMLDIFRGREHPEQSLYYDPDTDGHLNPRGNAVVAEALFEALTAHGWMRDCTGAD